MSESRQQPLGSGFGARSEPAEIMAGIDLSGRNAIVTGGYSGIGTETVRALVKAGANVTVPARSMDKAREVLADLDGVQILTMDLADIASVRAFARDWKAQNGALDLLINNAGIMACPETRVGPGWEAQFGTNHLGHFALTLALMDALKAADAPRVIALSSIGHRAGPVRFDDLHWNAEPYNKWAAYGQAKSANALFAVALDTRMAEFGGHAYSVHPGGIFTPLQRHLDVEEMKMMGWLGEDGEPSEAARERFKSTTQGATTTLWAATCAALEDRGGVYCEDCDIAALVAEDDVNPAGIRRHAIDPELAEQLWSVSEELLATA